MENKIIRGHIFSAGTVSLTLMSIFQCHVTPAQVDVITKVIQVLATLVTAYFAAKNYIYGIREKKANIKRMKDEEEFRKRDKRVGD